VVEDLVDPRRAEPSFLLSERAMLESWLEFHRTTLGVRVSEGADSSTTHVQLLSVLSAMYDWGKNRRNIEELLSYLLNAGIDFETTKTDRKYEFGGPLKYEFRGPV
jgi:hypothetical protein